MAGTPIIFIPAVTIKVQLSHFLSQETMLLVATQNGTGAHIMKESIILIHHLYCLTFGQSNHFLVKAEKQEG